MKRMIAASKNRHKIREIEQIIKQFGFEIVARDDADIPDIEIAENGTTFEENSFKKANEVMKLCGEVTIADDSGLVVDCLDGAPGIYSARFAGVEGDDEANNRKLVEMCSRFPYKKRTARYVCVITAVFPDGDIIVARGEVEGHISLERRGVHGFGYDPYFIPIGYDRTFGELEPEEKNKISHRAKALVAFGAKLERKAARLEKDI